MFQFLKCGEQIGYRSSPTIQPPHQHHIDFATPGSIQQFLADLPLRCSGAYFLHLHGNSPSTPDGVLTHGATLHGERLLIQRGDSGIQAGADRFGGLLPLAKNLPGFSNVGPLSYGHFR
jgi:hypothetical protein